MKKRMLSLLMPFVFLSGIVLSGCASDNTSSQKVFTVNFLGGGGKLTSGNVSQVVTSASEIVPPVYELKGYEFDSWNIPLSDVNEDCDVCAQWKIANYDIVYDLDGGNNNSKNPSRYNITQDKIALYPASKDGYEFQHWLDSKANIVTTIDTSSAKSLNYKAVYKTNDYKISYELEGGEFTGDFPVSYNTEEEIIIPNPYKTGFTFVGWKKMETGDEAKKDYVIKKGQYGDIKLFAEYEANKYQISFDTDGGEEISPQAVYYGDNFTLPTPTKNGYTFHGWFYNDSLFNNDNVWKYTSDVEIKASWSINTYRIIYSLEGGTNHPDNPYQYTVEDSIVFKDPVKTGYTFQYWRNMSAQKVTGISKGFIGDRYIFALWNNGDEYTIYLDANGGRVDNDSIKINYGKRYNLPTPTKYGYTFLGWYDGENRVYDYEEHLYENDRTLVAKWEVTNYKISYSLNGGENDINNPQTYTVNDEINLIDPARIGYTFLGWYDEQNNLVTSIEKGSSGDIVLAAKWNEGNSYTITLNPNGGELENTSLSVRYDKEYKLPTISRDGYKFMGWYDDDVKVVNNGIYTYASNKVYSARWVPVTYTITYIIENGSNDIGNPSAYTIEDSVVLRPASRSTPGYTFDGWYDLNSQKIEKIDVGSTGNVTLTAYFSANLYSLNISSSNSEKGTVSIVSGTGHTDEVIRLLATPKEGCLFKGWYQGGVLISEESDYSFNMPPNNYSLTGVFWGTDDQNQYEWDIAHGVIPVIDENNKTVKYGLYPQTRVTDTTLIQTLNSLDNSYIADNGWYLYEGEYYEKVTPSPANETYYAHGSIYFSDGVRVSGGAVRYWFRCDPIVWDIMLIKDYTYSLISKVLLDKIVYCAEISRSINGTTINCNNYSYSKLRAWLNGYDGTSYSQPDYTDNSFYRRAFGLDDSCIIETNGDKVYTLSVRDLSPNSSVFSKYVSANEARRGYVNDYAVARGARYYSGTFRTAIYWTSTSSNQSPYIVTTCDHNGSLKYGAASETNQCVRPAITINLLNLTSHYY